MSYIKIKNKKGTSDNKPPKGNTSWLEFWENQKGKKAIICEIKGCPKLGDVGGHVIKSGSGGKEYILPLCSKHNNAADSEEFEAWDGDLVPVND